MLASSGDQAEPASSAATAVGLHTSKVYSGVRTDQAATAGAIATVTGIASSKVYSRVQTPADYRTPAAKAKPLPV